MNPHIQRFSRILIVPVALAWLVACAAAPETTAPPPAPTADTAAETLPTPTTATDTEASAEAIAPASETRTIQHAMGQTEITCSPQRIVTLGQGATDSLLALGVKPVGIVDPWGGEWYDYLADQVEGIPSLGSELEPNLETIVSLNPDLIIGSKIRHEAIYDQLSEIAPTVFAETIGRVWQENMLLYAEAACLEDEAAKLVAAWDERIADFREKMGDKLATEVSLVRFRSDEARIYTTGFPGSILHDAGLARPEEQYFPIEEWDEAPQVITLSKEQIPMMDGDVMFYMVSDWGNTEATELQEDWIDEPLWQTLSVVQSGQTYPVNEQHWNLGGGVQAANRLLDDLYQFFLEQTDAAAAPADIFNRPPSVTVVETTADTRLIAHALGQTSIPANPQRIVSLDDALTDSLLALDLTPIAATTYYGLESFSPHLAPGLAEAANIGQFGSPNLEAIAALKPDLILSNAWTAEENYDLLTEIAPTVVFTDEYSYPLLQAVGRTVGKEAQAEARLRVYEQKADAARAALEAAIGDQTVALLRVFGQELRIEGGIGYTGPVLWDALGLTPHPIVKMDEWNETVSLELIPQLTADILLLMPEIDGEARTKELLASPLWQQLPAVRNGQVYTLNGYNHWLTIGILANEYSIDNLLEVLVANNAPASENSSSFPMTIEHKFGSTTVEAEPQRVISLGYSEQDPILALGVTPIAVRDWFGDQPYGVWPWAQDKLGDAQPELLQMPFGELNYEFLASLRPDLFVATHSGITAEEYEILSQIAPVLAQPGDYEDFGVPWQEQTILIGRALGREPLAEELVRDVEAQIAAAADPAFNEATIAWLTPAEGVGEFWATGEHTPPFRFFAALGLRGVPEIAELIGDQSSLRISSERLDLADASVLIVRAPTQEALDEIKANAVFQQLNVVRDDQVIYFVGDDPVYGAISFSTVLSLPYVVDELVPQLLEAVERAR